MKNVLMSTLILNCQRRCDQEGRRHIKPSEWQALISTQYSELYSIVAESGHRYFETEATITATGAASYTLPTDHLSTIGVDYILDTAGRRRSLQENMLQDRNGWSGLVGEAQRYTLVGQTIVLYPNPSSGSYRHLYIPQATDLTLVATTANVDMVTPDGEEFVVWGVAVKALAKSESNVQLAVAEREAHRERLADWALHRALNEPRRRVVRGDDYDMPIDPSDWRFR